MKIKKLEICGFKSFVDPTVLTFDHPVTGVVGPNGCGKSNIVDAIRWVMGEQSARNLRGKAMEDVIFNGSESRGPCGFAEVTITFLNTDGQVPPEYREYAEISVSRRLDRQGNSDYFINRTPVRLMDVTNLFLGTGVGRRAYSIIEQGRIGFIVSSKPEDRRYLIEEAAGVTKFRARKRAAERKMEQTRQNLYRVGDILQEIERSLASLKRQAQKAERYKRYRAEMRDLELHVASHRWLEATGARNVVSAELATQSGALESRRATLRTQEAGLEAERLALGQQEHEVEQAQARAYELDNNVRLLESQVSHDLERLNTLQEGERAKERELQQVEDQRRGVHGERDVLATSLAGLEEREREAQAALQQELEELDRRRVASQESDSVVMERRTRVAACDTRIARAETSLVALGERREEQRQRSTRLEEERQSLTQRIEEIDQGAAELRARVDGLTRGRQQTSLRRGEHEAELQGLRAAIREAEAQVEQLRERWTERNSRLRSLTEIHERFEGVGAGVRAVMGGFRSSASDGKAGSSAQGVVGILADRLECDPRITRALAGFLGDRLQHVVVRDLDVGMAVLRWLQTENQGRASIIPQQARYAGQVSRPSFEDDQGIEGWLADLVSYADEDRAAVQYLLRDVLVVRDLEAATRVHRQASRDFTVVTLGGDVISPEGFLTGGAVDDSGAHMLELKREMRELTEVVEELGQQLQSANEHRSKLRTAIAESQAALETMRSEAQDTEIEIVRAETENKRALGEAGRLRERIEAIRQEGEEVRRAFDRGGEEAKAAEAEIEEARRARIETEEQLRAAEQIQQDRRDASESQSGRVTEVRVLAAQARERAEADRSVSERLLKSLEELDAREAQLRADVEQGARRQGELIAAVFLAREQLAGHVHDAMKVHEELAQMRGHYDEAKVQLGQKEEELKDLRTEIDVAVRQESELTVKDRELALAMGHLLEQVQQRHRVDLRRILGDYHMRPIPDDQIEKRADELARLIERMGEINLTAIEEFEEKSERYTYLTSQKVDLEGALGQLERAIRQMNRECRRLFKEAFEAVNERFKRVFPTMFGGGRAELRLSDPNELLDSGVEIVAQPPGKRLGSLELMSGGEKALTAVSLIFSIFQYKPSPFCLLDEVDAPLDEANIGRFADAVQQMTDRSQFILITHAKRTMESTDVLYGVTMETPGISKLVSVELRGERIQVDQTASTSGNGRAPASGSANQSGATAVHA